LASPFTSAGGAIFFSIAHQSGRNVSLAPIDEELGKLSHFFIRDHAFTELKI